jgi:lipopolysaccharide export system ATP-binding protein
MNLRADHLVKKYKQRTVVNDVSFNVSQGEIVGLLAKLLHFI